MTEFELSGQVFVPAGDGTPAQWKTAGDLTVVEFARHAKDLTEVAALQTDRAERYAALVEKATLTREEFADAQDDAQLAGAGAGPAAGGHRPRHRGKTLPGHPNQARGIGQ